MKKAKIVFLSFLATSLLVGCNSQQNGNESNKDNDSSVEVTDVKGTYAKSFTTEEISGNVRHTGYLSALGAIETNTIVLGDNDTYTYTKYITTDTAEAAPKALPLRAEAAASNILFSWESAGDGNCSLDFNKDGSYEFKFTTMSLSEKGTWSCKNYQMKVITPGGNEMVPTMDSTTHAFSFTYTADAGGGRLTHDFKVEASVWGAAIGMSGTYEPVSSGEEDAVTCSLYYAGSGKKTSQGVEFDVSYELFLLSNGKLILQVESGGSTQYQVGTYGNGKVTIGETEITVTSQTEINYDGIKLTKADLPSKYSDTNFAELYETASKPVANGPVKITYTFTGTYVNEGNNRVTLNPASEVNWKEDWGKLQAQGFTNGEGDKNVKVFPKGETGDYFLPLDHFGADLYYAPAFASNVTNPEVTYNYKRTVKLGADGSFEYEAVQSSDDE